jgi:molecular chaperone GrpE
MGKKEAERKKHEPERTDEQKGSGSEDAAGEELDKLDKEYLVLRLKEKEKEAADNYDKYVRAVAELENYKKRAVKERTDAIMYGQERLLRDLLPMVDSLERACGQECTVQNLNAFQEGIKLIRDQLLSRLEQHGVKGMSAQGEDFDPNLHEAMLQVETEEHEENKVVEEFEKGYTLHGRLLRPARVSVSTRKKTKIQSNPN